MGNINPINGGGSALDALDINKRRIIIDVDLKTGQMNITVDKPILMITLADVLTKAISGLLAQILNFCSDRKFDTPGIGGNPIGAAVTGLLKGKGKGNG